MPRTLVPTLMTLGAALDLQVLDHRHGVAVGQDVAHRILDDPRPGFLGRGHCLGGPLVAALRADQERTHLIGVDTGTFGARRQGLIHSPMIIGPLH